MCVIVSMGWSGREVYKKCRVGFEEMERIKKRNKKLTR
jgi:hypothetical protein